MPTRKRRPAARGRSAARRRTTRRRPTRRPTSTASTLGTVAGIALAGLLAALLGGLPWWGWVLIIAVGLGAGAVWAVRRGQATEVDPAGVDLATDPDPAAIGPDPAAIGPDPAAGPDPAGRSTP